MTADPKPSTSAGLKAWRVQFDDWMAIAYAATRGEAAIEAVRHYGIEEDNFLAARVYRVPVLDTLAASGRGIEERHTVWELAGFNPYLDPVNRP